MRHRRNTTKLKRSKAHRKSLLANLSCSLIEHGRIKTTLGKAKALRPVVEKLVTQAKRGDLHSRRLSIAFLRQNDAVTKLFAEIAPRAADRKGGYCRILKLGQRMSDAAPMALIEWTDRPVEEEEDDLEAVAEEQPKKEKKVEKAEKADKETKEEAPTASE